MSRFLAGLAAATLALTGWTGSRDSADPLNDLEMAHVAITASDIDIGYARLALAKSTNPQVRTFAETMIRDHSAVNRQVVELAKKLAVTAQDNPLSRQLVAASVKTTAELEALSGNAFDRRYAANEAAYHQLVNETIRDTFIPNSQNADVKAAFQGALPIFLVHQEHAEAMDRALNGGGGMSSR